VRDPFFWFFLLGAVVLVELFYPVAWLLAPVRGRVVDKVTHKPVPHAIIAASWELEFLANSGQLDATEAETDPDGRFQMSHWRLRWQLAPGRLADNAPVVWVLRDGYLPYRTQGPSQVGAHLVSRMPELEVELEPAPLPTPAYGQAMVGLTAEMDAQFVGAPCNWSRIPKFVEQIRLAQRLLVGKGIAAGTSETAQRRDCRER
jgi:hypothetical protein